MELARDDTVPTLRNRLAAELALIVIIQTASTTPYVDFARVLVTVKQADVRRIVINPVPS